MRLGLSSYTYTWAVGVPGQMPAQPLTAFGLLDKAAALGVGVVQIADNLPLDRLSVAEIEALAAAAGRMGARIEVGTRGIQLTHLQAYLRLAARLASPILRVVIDTPEHHPAPDEVVALLGPAMPEFERAGITLAIENHDRFPAAVLSDIVRRLGSPRAGVCLDTVNSFGALEGPEHVVRTLAPFTVNLHVKDFTIARANHNMGFAVSGCPAGQGRLDVPWVLRELAARGRDPNAILELWTPPEPAIEATIAKEDAWARDSVAYLRGYIAA
jgi:sugar phosphate isomerase/epimerase